MSKHKRFSEMTRQEKGQEVRRGVIFGLIGGVGGAALIVLVLLVINGGW